MRSVNYKTLIWLAFGAVSCKPGTPHEILPSEKGYLLVELESKIQPQELREIAQYYYDDYEQDGLLIASFCIPAEYPDYPETPWAMVWIDGMNFSADDPQLSLRINGTLNETEKENLCNIVPVPEGIKGKWYFNEPMLESVYFLVENASGTYMLVFDAKEYYEVNGVPDSYNLDDREVSGRNDHADAVYELCPVPGANEYAVLPGTKASYRINEKGELILLNRQKSHKDTSPCVLQPLEF